MSDLATKLKAPKFWDKPNLLGKLLSPLGLLYQGISSYKQSQVQPFEASIPVIAVGNVTLGGAGKTPVRGGNGLAGAPGGARGDARDKHL